MRTRRNYVPLSVLVMMTAAVNSSFSPVANADQDSRWTVKGGIALVDTNTPFAIDKPSGGQVNAGGNAELGVNFALEYRWTDLIGLEFATVYSKSPDVDDSVNSNNDEIGEGPSFLPLIVGANFHLVSTEKVDVYVGPRVAFVQFSDFDLRIDGQKTSFEVDDEFAWGATAGVNYQVGDSRWSLLAEVTYLDVDMTITERGTSNTYVAGFDPLIVNVGASFRF